MPNFKKFTAIIFLIIVATSLTTPKSFGQESLDIKISNIRKNTGKVIVEIYNSQTNWLKTPFQTVALLSNQDVQIASFKVPYGKYAITIYQDLNDNGKADMNFMGIPKELVGFGNNYKPFGEPKFGSCLVEFKAASKPQEIKLYKVF